MKSRSIVLLGIASIALVLAVTISMFRTQAAIKSSALSDRDINEIRLLNEAYRTAWLRNDREAVVRTMTKDAVIIPSGLQPISGLEAIGKFWWPNNDQRPPSPTSLPRLMILEVNMASPTFSVKM